MIRRGLFLTMLLAAGPVAAETVVAARTIRSQAILTATDLAVIAQDIPGGFTTAAELVGLEARVVLYAGRPIRVNDVGPPALVERNQVVTLFYSAGPLVIATEARSLGRAGVGDRLRVMNLSSRSTVTGYVRADGSVSVGGPNLPSM